MAADRLDLALADLQRLVFGTDDEADSDAGNRQECRFPDAEEPEQGDNSSSRGPGGAVRVRIELGRARMSLAAAEELRRGGMLTLDRAANDPVDLVVGGRVVARGELLNVNDSLGIRICELVGPPVLPRELATDGSG